MSYDYTIIQVVCWVELPEQRRLCLIFGKIWIPIKGVQQCGIGSPEIHRNLSTRPPDLRRHTFFPYYPFHFISLLLSSSKQSISLCLKPEKYKEKNSDGM